MVQRPPMGVVQVEDVQVDSPVYLQKTVAQLEFLRLLVLYVISSFTGNTLTLMKLLGLDKLLQIITPVLRVVLAVLVCESTAPFT